MSADPSPSAFRMATVRRDIRLGTKNLLLHKLRSFLTMLGLVFGVGSVISMLAIGEGASEEALQRIRKLGSRNIIITSKKPSESSNASSGRSSFMSMYGLKYSDATQISETIPTVQEIVPVKAIQKDGLFGKRSMELRIVGTTADWFALVERDVIAGRVFTAKDEDARDAVAVLTEHGARKLMAADSAVGNLMRMGGNSYRIIGVVKSEAAVDGPVQMPDRMTDAYVPLTVAKEHFGDVFIQRKQGSNIREMVELHQLIVRVERDSDVEPTADAISRILERSHKSQDYEISIPLALLREAEATKRTFSIILGSIAGISLLVGGIGIMNIMLATVTERTREIGIRRAIGAKRRQIVAQFLVETLALSIIGGIIGIGVGLLIPWMVTQVVGMPTIVKPLSLVLALGISVTVGIAFGIYPAIRAAKLDPIEALRHE